MEGGGGRVGPAARFARAVVSLRYPIVVSWIAAAAAAAVFLPTLREAQVGSLGDLVPNDAEAIETERRGVEVFGFPVLSRTLVVERDPDGLSADEQLDAVQRALALNRGEIAALDAIGGALVATNTLGEPPFSRESSTTSITYLFFPPEVGQFGRAELAERFVEAEVDVDPGASVGVTGAIPARTAQAEEILDALPLVEAATVLLVGLAVGLHFRALGAPLMNLLAVGIAYLASIRVIAYLGSQAGVSVPSEVEPVVVVLLFGVITDYSIFFMSRYRQVAEEELSSTEDRREAGRGRRRAVERATAELLPIVVTAGLTIIGGSATLVFAQLGFLQAFGPGMALSVAIGLLVAITFVPAMLAIAGSILFWPSDRPHGRRRIVRAAVARAAVAVWRGVGLGQQKLRSGRARAGRSLASRLPRAAGVELPPERRSLPIVVATRWPLAVALVATAVLLAAASGLAKMDPANPLIRGLPDDSPVKRSYLAASKGFAPGILAPTVLLVEEPGVAGQGAGLARLQRLLARHDGVAEVVGPADQPLELEFGAVVSRTGDAARYVLILNADPLGGRAIRILEDIEERLPALLDRAGLEDATAGFAGDTALVAETVEQTFDDLARIAPLIALVVLLVLAAFLRALVAPLYLLASSVLALCASLGLLIYVFQDLLGYGEITYYVPFAAAVLLVSLGSDYNVFLVGRIWTDARRRPIRQAIVTGGASAARAITAAGMVLAGSFALLALVPIRSFRELAFTMSVGLLIDAFVVRTLLVPAVMSLAGRFSAWPSRRLFAHDPPPEAVPQRGGSS